MCLPVSVPQLCLSASIYQLEFEFPIRCVVLSENCCTSSPNKYNNMIIISSTCTEPSSSQRDPVHFEKIHSKQGGKQHLQTDTHPALLRVGFSPPSSSSHHVTDCSLGQDSGQTALSAPKCSPLDNFSLQKVSGTES